MYAHCVVWFVLLQAPLELPSEAPPGHSEAPLPSLPPSHPPIGGQGAARFADLPGTVARLDAIEGLRESPKTVEIASSIAADYAKVHRFEEAAFYYGQAWEQTAALRALFLELQKVEAEPACEELVAGKELALEFAKAQAQETKAQQAACLRVLLPQVLETGKQLAWFQVLAKNLEGAKSTLEALLLLEATFAEAAYALGALLLETEGESLASLGRAQKLLQQAVQAQHPSTRGAKGVLARVEAALEAGGNAKVVRGRSKAFKPERAARP